MQLNIKNHAAHELATRLAATTGESLTEAVTRSMRERLERIEKEASVEHRMAKLREITAEMRSRMPKPLPTQQEMDDWMYGEDGLPR